MNKTMRELEKAHKYFGEVRSRSTKTYFAFMYIFADAFAHIGAERGVFSFWLWVIALLFIFNLFKNAMDAA